jgi:hypothetical protein
MQNPRGVLEKGNSDNNGEIVCVSSGLRKNTKFIFSQR